MTTLTRCYLLLPCVLPVAVVLSACANESARAPNPTGYDWPDAFAYRVEYVAESVRDTEVVSRYDETKLLRFVVRDDRYLVWNDSVEEVQTVPGAGPQAGRVYPEDTLHYYVRLTRLGEFNDVEPGCDPAVAACHDVLPSALPLELRRLVPAAAGVVAAEGPPVGGHVEVRRSPATGRCARIADHRRIVTCAIRC